MSQENVEILYRGYEAMRSRDLHALLGVVHPEFEGTFRILEVEGVVYRGHEGMRRFAEEVWSVFPDWQPEVEDARVVGEETVVTKVRGAGRGVGSGAELDMTACQVVRFREGKVISMHGSPTEAEALEAVGLRE
jgi:ketosteroid isomerase-like protein